MDSCNAGDIERRLMRHRGSDWTGPVLKGREAIDFVTLPNEDQWDETNCGSAVCQHPQCWTSLRRIERGHPRILVSSDKSFQESEDKLPTLTIVNVMDTCLWSKKRQSSEFTFPKKRSLLWKPACRHHSRSQKTLHDKGVTSRSRSPKLSVLNLNEAKLPFSEDVRNMVVTWVPEETEKNISSVGKTPTFSSCPGNKRKKLGEKTKPSLYFSGRQYALTHSRSPGVIVPPPSPVHFFEQLSSKAIPLWAQVDMLPQDLLMECILAHEKSMTAPEMKTELAKMRKSLPPGKPRPDSAISSKMYLTIHPVTLQRPSLRYPEQVRKLQYNLKKREDISGPGSSGYRKQQKQQQSKVETSTEKQEAEKAKSDVEDQHSICLQRVLTFMEEVEEAEAQGRRRFVQGQRIPSGQEVKQKQEELHDGVAKKAFVKHVSAPMKDSSKYDLSCYYYTDYPAPPEGGVIYKEVSDEDETVVEMLTSSQSSSFSNISGIMDKTNWNPDLKLLRILQAGAEEDEENHLSRAQSEASVNA